ncbi:MAG: HEPN domain-containing protein [Candidatus Bathyarchaeia archaeon]
MGLPPTKLAAFSLEQSLQLFLKAKLLERGVEYPRTHSVRKLLEMLSEVGGGGKGKWRGASSKGISWSWAHWRIRI